MPGSLEHQESLETWLFNCVLFATSVLFLLLDLHTFTQLQGGQYELDAFILV